MATVVNNPQPATSDNGGYGFLLGIILLIAVLFLLFYYGLPRLSAGLGGGTQVNVPDHFNVNVQSQK